MICVQKVDPIWYVRLIYLSSALPLQEWRVAYPAAAVDDNAVFYVKSQK